MNYISNDGIVFVEPTDFPFNPRTGNENLFKIYIWNANYMSPDKINQDMHTFFSKFNKNKYIYYYIDINNYSGEISINEDLSLDDDLIDGIAILSKEKCRKEYNVKKITKGIKDKVFSVLNGEVELYNNYVNGECYFYQKYSFLGDEIDSCTGFCGDDFDRNGLFDYAGKPETLNLNEEILNDYLSNINVENQDVVLELYEAFKKDHKYEENEDYEEIFYGKNESEIFLKGNLIEEFKDFLISKNKYKKCVKYLKNYFYDYIENYVFLNHDN